MIKILKNGYTYIVIGTVILAFANITLLQSSGREYLKDSNGFALSGLGWAFLTTGILLLLKRTKK